MRFSTVTLVAFAAIAIAAPAPAPKPVPAPMPDPQLNLPGLLSGIVGGLSNTVSGLVNTLSTALPPVGNLLNQLTALVSNTNTGATSDQLNTLLNGINGQIDNILAGLAPVLNGVLNPLLGSMINTSGLVSDTVYLLAHVVNAFQLMLQNTARETLADVKQTLINVLSGSNDLTGPVAKLVTYIVQQNLAGAATAELQIELAFLQSLQNNILPGLLATIQGL